jgi:hypothetical protein
MNETEVTAYHEAAHMCTAWELGLSVTGATIIPDPEKGYAGRVLVPVEDRVRYADWVDEREYLYCHLVTYCAGVVASEKITGVPLPPEAVRLAAESYGSDHYSVADLLLTLGGPDGSEREEVEERALRRAMNLIRVRWECIETVASVLMQRETLDEAECREVLENAFRR